MVGLDAPFARLGRRLRLASGAILALLLLVPSTRALAQGVDPALFRSDCRFDTGAAERALRGVAQDVGAAQYRVEQDWTRGGVTTEIPDDMCPQVVLTIERPVWGTVSVKHPPPAWWVGQGPASVPPPSAPAAAIHRTYDYEVLDWYGHPLELETYPAAGPLPERQASLWHARPLFVSAEITGDRAELERWNEAIVDRFSKVGLIGPVPATPPPVATPAPTPAPAPAPAPATVTLTVARVDPVAIPGTVEIVADVSVSGGDSTAQVLVDVRPLDPTGSTILSLIGPATAPATGGRRTMRLQAGDPRPAVESGALNLASLTLTPTFELTARIAGAPAAAVTMQLAVPLDAILLRGTTVDAEGNPRDAGTAPRYLEMPSIHLASQRDPADPSRFFVLVQGRDFAPNGKLKWSRAWDEATRADLLVPTSVLARRLAGQATAPGSTMDVGKIDVLEPAEHEARARQWVREFLLTMGFDNGYLGTTVGTLPSLPVQYAASYTGASPRYGGGQMYIPMPAEQYWNGVEAVDGDDTAYAIFIHELGHFVHQSMVDRHIGTISIIDKFRVGGDHKTWRVPSGARTDWSVEATSFFEAIADYFAYAVFDFVERRHPDIRDRSIYFDRGYLDAFSTFDRARDARTNGGWKIEGVQSTFWRELYAPVSAASADGPSRAFGDLLRMADLYKKESWLLRWVPARSVRQWLAMKRAHAPVADLDRLAEKYAIEGSGMTRWMSPIRVVTGGTVATIDGTRVEMIGSAAFQDVAVGQRVEVLNGEILVEIDEWGARGTRVHVHAGRGTVFVFETPGRLRVQRGEVTVDGRIVLAGGQVTVRPRGTLVRLAVDATGEAEVTVVEGAARVDGPSGSVDLALGESVRASSTGALGPKRRVDVDAVLAGVLGDDPAEIAYGPTEAAPPDATPVPTRRTDAEPAAPPAPAPVVDEAEHQPTVVDAGGTRPTTRPGVDAGRPPAPEPPRPEPPAGPIPDVDGPWRVVTGNTDPPAEFLLHFVQSGRTLRGTMERIDEDELEDRAPIDRIEGRIEPDGMVVFRRILPGGSVQRYEGRLVTSEAGRITLTGFFDEDGAELWRWWGETMGDPR